MTKGKDHTGVWVREITGGGRGGPGLQQMFCLEAAAQGGERRGLFHSRRAP